MSSATVDSSAAATTTTTTTTTIAVTATDGPLQVESIQTVDLDLLSQSDLYSLSLCSPYAFDPRRCDDVIIPKIDRSVFNESAGSRKQTYSRLRLAPASSPSSSSSLRSRTPHLRSSSSIHSIYSPSIDTDPERAENSQIVTLLKQLFGAGPETSTANLIPIRVEYDTVPHLSNVGSIVQQSSLLQFSNVGSVVQNSFVPQLSNVSSIGQKRKRGRPRKNENVRSVEVEIRPEHIGVGGVNVDVVMNDVVVNENVKDSEKEILNKDGVPVDLQALGALEDPFGTELRRRTEGLGREEELLEFMKGLNGQWGSSRKKKRIVDAGEFGNVLPKSWKLLLSVKKKEGRVWLYCRRYISPNGQKFDTCKEVSSYLLFLNGERNEIFPTYAKSSEVVGITDTCAFVGTSDLKGQDGSKKDSPILQTYPAVGHGELQVMLNGGELSEVQVGEHFQCGKCNMAFNDKDDLLQHQLSSHRRKRSKNGQSITDGVIIKEGKFECQFCHKTFEERHRYNGHVGNHVKKQVKTADGSHSINMGVPVEPMMSSGAMPRESIKHDSAVSLRSLTEIVDINADEGCNPAPSDKIEKHEYMETDNKQEGMSEAMDTAPNKSNLCLGSEAVICNNKDNTDCETLGNSLIVDIVTEGKNGGCHNQEGSSESYKLFPFTEKACVTENKLIVCSNVEEPKREALLGSNNIVDSCVVSVKDVSFSPTVDELKLVSDRFVDNEPMSALCSNVGGMDENSSVSAKQSLHIECHSGNSVDVLNDVNVLAATSKQIRDLRSSIGTPSGDEEGSLGDNVKEVFSGCLGEQKPSSMCIIKDDDCGSLVESNDSKLTALKQRSGSFIPHPDKNVNSVEGSGNEVSACFLEEPGQQKDNETGLLSLAGDKNRVVRTSSFNDFKTTIHEPKINEPQNSGSNVLVFPSSNNHTVQRADAGRDINKEKSLAFCSPFPSTNVRESCAEHHDTSVYKRTVEVYNQQKSGSALFSSSRAPEASGKEYTKNMSYTNPLNESRFDGLETSRHHDLNLAFGNSHVDLGAKLNSIHPDRYLTENSIFQCDMEQTYGVHNNVHRSLETDKQGEVGIDLSDSAFKEKTGEFECNLNMDFPSKLWEECEVDEVGHSAKKIINGFGSDAAEPNDDVMAGSIWRTGVENVMQGGSAGTSTSVVQSSNCFQTYDVMSDKVQGIFGENDKFDSNTGFDGLRSDRTEPVEYSFMSTQSLDSLQEEPRVLPYDVDIEQGFNSPFWLGKDDLMPNLAGRNQVTLVCVWCGNEFYQEPNQLGAQVGSIGTMCPTCSGRMSGQLNFL